ncbi:hypothetical protein SELMODRAFT_411484 [Selaginella moellendorffii]|uniref:Uncharacterized protein n=1 Tax=Selaginella moellendorffii TaxID=88036 RepID=D8RI34_SELML|nr:hypothetical protein SELMODRAFT_411484 [Selaginella moellendorffii]
MMVSAEDWHPDAVHMSCMADTNSKSNWCPVCMVGMDPNCNNGSFPQDRKGKVSRREKLCMSYSSRLRSSTSTGLPGRNLAISTPTSAATPAEDPYTKIARAQSEQQARHPLHLSGEEPLDLCAKSRWSDLVALYTPTGSKTKRATYDECGGPLPDIWEYNIAPFLKSIVLAVDGTLHHSSYNTPVPLAPARVATFCEKLGEGLLLPLQGVVDGSAASLLWQNFGKGGSSWRADKLFEEPYRQAEEWRTREIARDIAKKRQMEMVLVVEKLQELRSLRVQKLKKQGHLFPEDDDAFTESVLPANAEEQTTRNPSTDDENTIKEAPP